MLNPQVLKTLSIARSGVYFLESLPIALVSRWLTHKDLPPPTNSQIKTLWKQIVRLHERESKNLELGLYPVSALELENPVQHARSFLNVLSDGVRVAWRMRKNKTKEFSKPEATEGMPDYYTRNFHFQTDGYFSEASAKLYDHQVEILFSGTAGAMRRLILPVLSRTTQGSGRWLELGCGSGSATRGVLETFPKARVTALDLSAQYLKIAQENLRSYDKVDFLQGDASALTFKDETFEAVFSVYLLHEMPKEVRERVIREAWRVLKPGGVLVFADSLQIGDEPELNWALERFPKVYHEPFYKGYSKDKLEALIEKQTRAKTESEHAFFTKVVWAQKPFNSSLS
jgi:ubiquinone/menaquinone biosynthesis C-methylase UbiE